ncbi:ubiquinol-cytochrome c reductase iron-sulfur subunit [Baekduia sp.]|jgi:ubiquinol-cytochrome c reductase iron-sulfur subunit|uniref:QcrA and Rieske domain-containing protein n=1 Tax=Baekduia sp. TaxID=2600305 RepID=UPI002DFF4074|nr:Rieske 2Fe-2S domain-containing protein [Baekduia sp.]
MMKALIARLAVLVGVVRGVAHPTAPPAPDQDGGVDPRRYETGSPPWAEPLVAGLLVAAGTLLATFGVLIAVDANTQLLGLALGLGLAALAAALIVASKRVLPRETAVEDRPIAEPRAQQQALEEELRGAADGVSRRGLLTAAAGTAGVGAIAAAALPLSALGPSAAVLDETSRWRDGIRLVDEDGKPINADVLEDGAFLTAFPEGADKRELGSPVVVVRVAPSTLRLPPDRRGWAPDGLLAYSKICTHAGCAVSLFRTPTDEALSSPPGLVCPCHYSTFDVRRAAKPVFGPASRPLPQLPLKLDAERNLVAAGPLSGSVGPAWWGTKGRHA